MPPLVIKADQITQTLAHLLPFSALAAGFPAFHLPSHQGITPNITALNATRNCASGSYMYCGPTSDAIRCALVEGTTCSTTCTVDSTNSWCSSNCKCTDQKIHGLSDGFVYFASGAHDQHASRSVNLTAAEHDRTAHVLVNEDGREGKSASNFKFTTPGAHDHEKREHVEDHETVMPMEVLPMEFTTPTHEKRQHVDDHEDIMPGEKHQFHVHERESVTPMEQNHPITVDAYDAAPFTEKNSIRIARGVHEAPSCQLQCSSDEMAALCQKEAKASCAMSRTKCGMGMNGGIHVVNMCSSMCDCVAAAGSEESDDMAVDDESSHIIKRHGGMMVDQHVGDEHFMPAGNHYMDDGHIMPAVKKDFMPVGVHHMNHIQFMTGDENKPVAHHIVYDQFIAGDEAKPGEHHTEHNQFMTGDENKPYHAPSSPAWPAGPGSKRDIVDGDRHMEHSQFITGDENKPYRAPSSPEWPAGPGSKRDIIVEDDHHVEKTHEEDVHEEVSMPEVQHPTVDSKGVLVITRDNQPHPYAGPHLDDVAPHLEGAIRLLVIALNNQPHTYSGPHLDQVTPHIDDVVPHVDEVAPVHEQE